jgi:tRNA(fMet)-specific endonuclease VapC
VYLLDTDISIYLLNGRLPQVAARLADMERDEVGTTVITAAELRYGALHSSRPQDNLARVETFLPPLLQIPFDSSAAIQFGRVKSDLAARGVMIGSMDLLIASCVLAVGGTLITNNVREFSRVFALPVENWAHPQ